MRAWAVALVAVGAASGCAASGCAAPRAPPPGADAAASRQLILISIDGFRWDYLDRDAPPALTRLAEEGVRAESMIPAFPSKTFPNHYTLVTGLYPEHHGVVGNHFWDPDSGERFSIDSEADQGERRWWGGEPIWVTAERQGVRAGVLFWPGSEAKIGGRRPSYWAPYVASTPGEERVAQIFEWMALPERERPRLMTLYFSPVDGAGHRHGPDSEEVSRAVATVDGFIGDLVEGLEARGRLDETDIVVVSDHGMTPVSAERFVDITALIAADDARLTGSSPVLHLWPAEGRQEAVLAALEGVEGVTAWRREAVPERLHHSDHPRIAPVVLAADPGWSVGRPASAENLLAGRAKGNHGFDNQHPDMGALFIARGPSFGGGLVVAPFESVHVYPLLARVLGVEPAPSDGDPAVSAGWARGG